MTLLPTGKLAPGKIYMIDLSPYSEKVKKSIIAFPVKLYPEPSPNVPFHGSFSMDETIVVLENVGDFTKVLTSKGIVGYAHNLSFGWKVVEVS